MRVTLTSGTAAEFVSVPGAERGLVVAPDIGGLGDRFDGITARLARETGRSVIAVEPWPGYEFPDGDNAARLAAIGKLHDLRVVGDLLDAAAMTGCADVGLIGFCMGGMYTHKAAATGRFDRLVSFYGMIEIPDEWNGPGHTPPLDALAQLADPSIELAIIGDLDPYTPPADLAKLAATGIQIAQYPEAGHGFAHVPGRDDHRPVDAADAWARALAHIASVR